jgi:phosphoglycolate phosphatase-like HAD superfamily hydrolase
MNRLIDEYKTFVFDCDGVVLNSNKIKTEAFYKTTKFFGHEFAKELLDYHVVNGGMSRYLKFDYFITRILKKPHNKVLKKDLLTRFAKNIKEGLMTCEVASGIEQLKAKTQTTNWLIVSGSDQTELRELFKVRNLDYLFKGGIFGSPDSKETILAREIKKKNIKKPTLFFGDSKYDYLAAKKAGLDFVFLSKWSEVKNYQSWCYNNKISIKKDFLDYLLDTN